MSDVESVGKVLKWVHFLPIRLVIPAEAGIQILPSGSWIPVFTGMTK
jgi:hypothetical protein